MHIDKKTAGWIIGIWLGTLSWAVAALDTAPIAGVFQKTGNGKTVPTGTDADAVTQFITAATEQILWAEKPEDAIDARVQLLAYRGQDAYAQAYVTILRGRLESAIKEAMAFSDAAKKAGVLRNFSILIAQMDTLELATLTVGLLGEPDSVIRYWAVKALTSDKINSQLVAQSTTDASGRKKIIDALVQMASKEDQAAILGILARYAAKSKGSEGREILLTAADNRMQSYASWKTTQESADLEVLTALVDKLGSSVAPEDKNVLMGRFAQYYSYVIQRYAKGQDFLSPKAKQGLVSTIIGVEESLLSGPTLLNRKATELRSAIQKNNMEALMKAHDALLGSAGGVGELAGKIKFSYEGNATAPKTLIPPLAAPNVMDSTAPSASADKPAMQPNPAVPPQPKPAPQPKPKAAPPAPAS